MLAKTVQIYQSCEQICRHDAAVSFLLMCTCYLYNHLHRLKYLIVLDFCHKHNACTRHVFPFSNVFGFYLDSETNSITLNRDIKILET